MNSDKTKTYVILFMAIACMAMANKVVELRKESEPMRVKQFEDKILENPSYIEITHHFAKSCATEGKRVDATARLLTLCRFAYNLGANKDLEADPPPRPIEYARTAPPGVEPPAPPEVATDGDEAKDEE